MSTTGTTSGQASIPAQAPTVAAASAGAGDAESHAVDLGATDGPEAAIAAGRARIDELDSAIIDLVRQRLQVSRGIQRVRLAAGGRRVEHSREVDIVNAYAAALGRPGADLALTLLALSRGPALGQLDTGAA